MTAAGLAGRAASAHSRARGFAAAVPIGFWLGALVLLSASIRLELALADPAPWIYQDELLYTELAKSFGTTGSFAAREVPGTGGFGIVYPLLIAPAYALFDSLPHAYEAIKWINAGLMSLTAIPVYFLARRLVTPFFSLLASALAVAVPSLVYTSTAMTENAFYPIFATALLVMTWALERPTIPSQLLALGLASLAFFTRAQGIALLPAFLTALVLVALLDAPGAEARTLRATARRLAAYRATFLLLAGGAVLYFAVEAVRGRSPREALLGPYTSLAESEYSLVALPRWFLYHVAELDLYLGVVPFAALLLLLLTSLRRGVETRAMLAFSALSASVLFWMTLLVARVAATPQGQRIQERYLFYVAPLFLIALVYWVDRGLPRPWPRTAIALIAAAALPGVIPYARFINERAVADTLALLPLWRLQEDLVAPGQVAAAVVVGAVALVTALAFLPPRLALVLPVFVLAYFSVVHWPVESLTSRASDESRLGSSNREKDWIDRTVTPDANVAALWSGVAHFVSIWNNEVFNRSIGPLYTLGPPPDGLPSTPLFPDPASGVLRDASGVEARSDFVLVDRSVVLEGEVAAQDPLPGMLLYRVGGPIVVIERMEGRYPDNWSGPGLQYSRYGCEGGILTVGLSSDANLHRSPQTVVALVDEKEVARTSVAVGSVDRFLDVPLTPNADGTCVVRFGVSPTAVPALVLGTRDTRELGVRFFTFIYDPSS